MAVTGGYGFIGQHVLRALADVGAEPVALVQRDDHATDVPGERRIVDLLDPVAVADATGGMDLVVHLAARSGGIQFQHGDHRRVFKNNTAMTRNVLDAAVAAGVRRVFLASSGVVYSRHAGEVLAEDRPVVSPAREPVTGYAWSKLTDEALGHWIAADSNIEVVIGRFANVYGPGGSFDLDRSTVVHSLIKKAVDAAPDGSFQVWGDGTPTRSFVYVHDAALAVTTILARGESGQVYNVSATGPVSIGDLALKIGERVSPGLAVTFDADRPQGPAKRVLDASKLESLGFVGRTPLLEGLDRTIAAYRSA